jgi:two-component system, cell cycle sensor histidine kinase and response regulator CckA
VLPGHGSTFKLLLPLTNAGVVPDAWAMLQKQPWQGAGTILVVDDEPMVRDVATAILKRAGMTVVTADNGDEAVERFAAEPHRFALVLVDLTMPGLSGAETLRQIHDIRPEVPVVVMSGYNEEEASGRFDGKELAGFLEKPFSTGALTAVVERALGGPGGVSNR